MKLYILIGLVLFLIVLSGCTEEESEGTEELDLEPEPSVEILKWQNNEYKYNKSMKLISPEPRTYKMHQLNKMKVAMDSSQEAVSYILLDMNHTLLNETSFKPEFQYQPKYWGKHKLYILSVYPDGERTYANLSFKIEDKKIEYRTVCDIFSHNDTVVWQNVTKTLSCDIVIPKNKTLELHNVTLRFEGTPVKSYENHPNQSIGYGIIVEKNGTLSSWESTYTTSNAFYWAGFTLHNGSTIDWYYIYNGSKLISQNKAITNAYRLVTAYEGFNGVSVWEHDTQWTYGTFNLNTITNIYTKSLFYESGPKSKSFESFLESTDSGIIYIKSY